jgi:hypothetical protein
MKTTKCLSGFGDFDAVPERDVPRQRACGGGDAINPVSISPWQLAQTSTHFVASSR